MSLAVLPFLKWPGGKRWLAPVIAQAIEPFLSDRYIEPFLGAGAVFFRLQPEQAVLSDINKELVDCVLAVRRMVNGVLRNVRRWANDAECYERLRHQGCRTAYSAAARFIYLNHTCWGGLYRVNRQGKFNVPFGNSGRRICDSENLRACANCLSKAKVLCEDFEPVMDGAHSGDVVYADPPYTTLGENNGFIRYNECLFAWRDQERLAFVSHRAAKRGALVAVSNLAHGSILHLYEGWWCVRVRRKSRVSAKRHGRRQVTEALIVSEEPAPIERYIGQHIVIEDVSRIKTAPLRSRRPRIKSD